MKYIAIFGVMLLFAFAVMATNEQQQQTLSAEVEETAHQDQVSAASNYSPLLEKRQEKRYVAYNGVGGGGGYGGYGGYDSSFGSGLAGTGGYYNPYGSRLGLGLDGNAAGIYNSGFGYGANTGGYGAAGVGGYGGYGGYNSNPYALSYYNSRLGSGGSYGYPGYGRAGYGSYGYNSYPSSYYSSNYGNSVVGGGLGALGAPPIGIGGAGYQYGPGISGTVY